MSTIFVTGFCDGQSSNETLFALKHEFHDDNTWMEHYPVAKDFRN